MVGGSLPTMPGTMVGSVHPAVHAQYTTLGIPPASLLHAEHRHRYTGGSV